MASVSGVPRVVVILDRGATNARVLRAAGTFTGRGLLEVKRRILASEPVIDEEMFSNTWFDERAEMLLALLTHWQGEGISFEIREVVIGGDSADSGAISLEVLRNIIASDESTPAEGSC